MKVTLSYVINGKPVCISSITDSLDIDDVGLFVSVAELFPIADSPVKLSLKDNPDFCVKSSDYAAEKLENDSATLTVNVATLKGLTISDVCITIVHYDVPAPRLDAYAMLQRIVDRHHRFAEDSLGLPKFVFPRLLRVSRDEEGLVKDQNFNIVCGPQASLFDYFNRIIHSSYILKHTDCPLGANRYVTGHEFIVDGTNFEFRAHFSTGAPTNIRIRNAIVGAPFIDILIDDLASLMDMMPKSEHIAIPMLDRVAEAAPESAAETVAPTLPKKAVKKLIAKSEKMLAEGDALSKRTRRKMAAASAIVRDTGALIGPRVLEHSAVRRLTRYTCVTKDRGVFASKAVTHEVSVENFHHHQIATLFSQLPLLSGFAIGPNFYIKTGRTTAVRVHSHADSTPCDMKKVTFGLKTKVMASTDVKLSF